MLWPALPNCENVSVRAPLAPLSVEPIHVPRGACADRNRGSYVNLWQRRENARTRYSRGIGEIQRDETKRDAPPASAVFLSVRFQESQKRLQTSR
jgi:hypothetical protein